MVPCVHNARSDVFPFRCRLFDARRFPDVDNKLTFRPAQGKSVYFLCKSMYGKLLGQAQGSVLWKVDAPGGPARGQRHLAMFRRNEQRLATR